MQDVNRSIYCSMQYKYVALLRCTTCKKYPCDKITEEVQRELVLSGCVRVESVSWKKRRTKMFIGKNSASGELEILRESFSTDNATAEEIMKYSEVLFVSKVYVPEMRLVPKSKQERDAVTRMPIDISPAQETEKKQRKKRSPA